MCLSYGVAIMFYHEVKQYTHPTSTMVDAGNEKCWHWVWKTKSTGTEDYGCHCSGQVGDSHVVFAW